jgi:hypothetical protein
MKFLAFFLFWGTVLVCLNPVPDPEYWFVQVQFERDLDSENETDLVTPSVLSLRRSIKPSSFISMLLAHFVGPGTETILCCAGLLRRQRGLRSQLETPERLPRSPKRLPRSL